MLGNERMKVKMILGGVSLFISLFVSLLCYLFGEKLCVISLASEQLIGLWDAGGQRMIGSHFSVTVSALTCYQF